MPRTRRKSKQGNTRNSKADRLREQIESTRQCYLALRSQRESGSTVGVDDDTWNEGELETPYCSRTADDNVFQSLN